MSSAPVVLRSQLANLLNAATSGGSPGESSSEPSITVTRTRRVRRMSVIAMGGSGSSSGVCPIHILGNLGGLCSCSPEELFGNSAPPATSLSASSASPTYIRLASVRSRPTTADSPLCVVSLDGVVDARLPYHLSGGYTDVISRPYLQTLMKYLLHHNTPWCFVFFSSLPRETALKTLEELNLPTGGPEDDERDGVLGLFAADDMQDWTGLASKIKDLDSMWKALKEEEGVDWGVHNTVVLTSNPNELAKQPYNFIHVPRLLYKSTVSPADDMFLLLAIAALKDLETETNFAYHIKEMGWNDLKVWTSLDSTSRNERNEMLFNAVRICATCRISIKAFTGNRRKSGSRFVEED
ncbi:hypothetical protein JCM10212_003189 [Sporobolomyces blumeae]